MTYRKKLIEVSLPLDAINENSALETNIRFGHPKTIFPWWARRPLVTCRAILFASLVDDPSQYLVDEHEIINERDRLFSIIEQLIKWENLNNEGVLDIARVEIARSLARKLSVDLPIGKLAIKEFLNKNLPPIYDPFAGGGAIPLEAQRLGLNVLASDINPIPVLINQVMIQLVPDYINSLQVNPQNNTQTSLFSSSSSRYSGLVEDIKYYGNWMKEKAWEKIGHLYPIGPNNEVVAAWIWARMIESPNPTVKNLTPLVGSFWLNQKSKQRTWIEPSTFLGNIKFEVKTGIGNPPEGTINSRGGICFFSKTPIPLDYIRDQGKQGKISYKLMAIITSSKDGKKYYSPDSTHEEIANVIKPEELPEGDIPGQALGIRVQLYGIEKYTDLFTNRQLIALTTFIGLLENVYEEVLKDSKGDKQYAKLITTLLSFAICRYADYGSTMTFWDSKGIAVKKTFGLPALQMRWAFPETNPFGDFSGNWTKMVEGVASSIGNLPDRIQNKHVFQQDARSISLTEKCIISTDPPYYDNIGYAALSDYFYVWLRKALLPYYPDLLSTILTPKQSELIAEPARHRNKAEAAKYFEAGLEEFFNKAINYQSRDYPTTIYYAFKQTDTNDTDNLQTGWEVFLNSLVKSGFQINGTWPVRTESRGGLRIEERNALASSILLACRPRLDSISITKKQFLSELKKELPQALFQLQSSNIAPVDFAQAAIGPGIGIYSRYSQILEADGSLMTVRDALSAINTTLDEFLAEQEGEYDGDTRWALAWFEQYGHDQGPYGIAETLSKAKNTSVEGLSHAGFLEARAGKVRLLKRDELDRDWDPTKDKRLTAWEAAQYLIRTLDKEGEKGTGALLGKLGTTGETARDLAYRLYTICERKGWAQDALAYNMLVVAWPRIKEQSGKGPRQESLL